MGETSFQIPRPTDITPGIAENKLKKGIVGGIGFSAEPTDEQPPEGFIVRVRKNQEMVRFTLNTKRMVERRETERANEMRRRAGR
jgi:hypothetical protein